MSTQERKKSGPKPRFPDGKVELHLKFTPEVGAYIRERSKEIGYQAYFDRLVARDQEQEQKGKQS